MGPVVQALTDINTHLLILCLGLNIFQAKLHN